MSKAKEGGPVMKTILKSEALQEVTIAINTLNYLLLLLYLVFASSYISETMFLHENMISSLLLPIKFWCNWLNFVMVLFMFVYLCFSLMNSDETSDQL